MSDIMVKDFFKYVYYTDNPLLVSILPTEGYEIPIDWKFYPASDTYNYAGESAADQLETQLLMKFMDDHRDAFIMTNRHSAGADPAAGVCTGTRKAGRAARLKPRLPPEKRKTPSAAVCVCFCSRRRSVCSAIKPNVMLCENR